MPEVEDTSAETRAKMDSPQSSHFALIANSSRFD